MKFEFEISDDEITRLVHDELKKAAGTAILLKTRSYLTEHEVRTRINQLWPATVDAAIEAAFADQTAIQAKIDAAVERKLMARATAAAKKAAP